MGFEYLIRIYLIIVTSGRIKKGKNKTLKKNLEVHQMGNKWVKDCCDYKLGKVKQNF